MWTHMRALFSWYSQRKLLVTDHVQFVVYTQVVKIIELVRHVGKVFVVSVVSWSAIKCPPIICLNFNRLIYYLYVFLRVK